MSNLFNRITRIINHTDKILNDFFSKNQIKNKTILELLNNFKETYIRFNKTTYSESGDFFYDSYRLVEISSGILKLLKEESSGNILIIDLSRSVNLLEKIREKLTKLSFSEIESIFRQSDRYSPVLDNNLEKNYEAIKIILDQQVKDAQRLKIETTNLITKAHFQLDQISDLKTALENDLQFRTEELDGKIAELDKKLSNSASTLLAQDYSMAAANEKTAANSLRLCAIAIIILIIAIAIITIKITLSAGDIDIPHLVARGLIILTLSLGAAYFSRESTKHRQQQYFFHERALGLSTINMYLASMEKDRQDLIKQELSSHFFSRTERINLSNSFPLDIQETFNRIIDKIPKK